MAHDRVGRCLIVCHSKSRPGANEWSDYLDRLARADFELVLISSQGGGPSPAQRGDWEARWRSLGRGWPRTALLTDSPVPRGMLTAMSWATKMEFKAFPFHAVQSALTYLGVPPEHRPEAALTIARLHDDLDESPDA